LGRTQRTDSLVVLGSSATKRISSQPMTAIDLYDSPMYQVLRSHLRTNLWPTRTSLAVLSTEHGLVGVLAPIETYGRRTERIRASELSRSVRQTLDTWSDQHGEVTSFVGKDYLPAIESSARNRFREVKVVPGMVGQKLSSLRRFLRQPLRLGRHQGQAHLPATDFPTSCRTGTISST